MIDWITHLWNARIPFSAKSLKIFLRKGSGRKTSPIYETQKYQTKSNVKEHYVYL
jgi:hypothetical protein